MVEEVTAIKEVKEDEMGSSPLPLYTMNLHSSQYTPYTYTSSEFYVCIMLLRVHTSSKKLVFTLLSFSCALHQSHQIIHFFTNSYVDHLETFLYRLFISQNPAITSLTLWLIGTISYLIHFNYSNRTLLQEYK